MAPPQPVHIQINHRRVGKLEFVETEESLRQRGARRASDSFILTIPALLTLDWQAGPWQPVVSNLHAFIYYDDNSGIELGVAKDLNTYTAKNPRLDAYSIELEWRGRPEALALIEEKRNGGTPKFWIRCFGEACPSFPQDPKFSIPDLRGVSERIFGEVHVSYPRDAWTQQMDALTSHRTFLVEIPVRKDLPDAWREISGALEEARRNLGVGGDDGWKACVGAVRLALEKWQTLEPEDQGPGWKAPAPLEKGARTKKQRADAIRWHLLQLAHLSPHSPAENWRRNDAVLAFTMLAALIAERDP